MIENYLGRNLIFFVIIWKTKSAFDMPMWMGEIIPLDGELQDININRKREN